jgi:hypothetical protein
MQKIGKLTDEQLGQGLDLWKASAVERAAPQKKGSDSPGNFCCENKQETPVSMRRKRQAQITPAATSAEQENVAGKTGAGEAKQEGAKPQQRRGRRPGKTNKAGGGYQSSAAKTSLPAAVVKPATMDNTAKPAPKEHACLGDAQGKRRAKFRRGFCRSEGFNEVGEKRTLYECQTLCFWWTAHDVPMSRCWASTWCCGSHLLVKNREKLRCL